MAELCGVQSTSPWSRYLVSILVFLSWPQCFYRNNHCRCTECLFTITLSSEEIHSRTNETWQSAHPLGIQGGVRFSLSPHPHQFLKSWEDWCPTRRQWGRESEFSLAQPVYSIKAFNRLEEAQPHCRGQSALLILNQMLISSRNAFTDRPWIIFNQISEYPTAQSSWYVKLTTIPSYWRKWPDMIVGWPLENWILAQTGWQHHTFLDYCAIFQVVSAKLKINRKCYFLQSQFIGLGI